MKSLRNTFQPLVELPVNLYSSNVSNSYMTVAPEIDINDFLDWHATDYFHIILSVKVDGNSGFIPFFSILNGGEAVQIPLRKSILLEGQNKIKYNYVDFLSNFEFRNERILQDIPRVSFSFDKKKGVNNIRIGQKDVTEGTHWLSEQSTDLIQGETNFTNEDLDIFQSIKDRLSEMDSFVSILSSFYYSNINPKTTDQLFFAFFSMDTDYQESGFLTRLMVISTDKDEISRFMLSRINKLREIVSFIRTRYIRDLLLKSSYEATKSAKAAVMSRNMSHNLGSHVMAYLKQHLGSVKEMLRSNVLSSLVEEENYVLALLALSENDIDKAKQLIASTIAKNIPSTTGTDERTNDNKGDDTTTEDTESEKRMDPIENVALPFLVGLGQFISYLQERQDFIATIATDFVPYFSTINFKDYVYDEINNDKRYERHPDRQNLKPDNILLGNIARSEGLGRETCPTSGKNKTTLGDIIIKFRSTFTGDPVEKIGANKRRKAVEPLKYYKNQEEVDNAFVELNDMRKYNISLPGGVVGRQAIFSIFENIIRNAAKHGNWKEKGELEITIDIFSKEDIKIEKHNIYRQYTQNGPYIKMSNDAKSKNHLSLGEVIDKFYLNSKDSDDIFIMTLTDNLTFSEDDLAKLRMAIAEPYVDRDGKMKEANKGIKEMRISASWLRSINDESHNRPLINGNKIDEPTLEDLKHDIKWSSPGNDNVAPVLYARISKEGKDEHLQYIFCIVKPKKVAFVSSEFGKAEEDFPGKKIFSKKGWKILTPEAFIRNKNKNFDYIVFDDKNETVENYNMVRRHSPSLFYKLTQVKDILMPIKEHITLRKRMNDKTLELILEEAYRGLGEKLASWDGNEKILILDDRSKSNYDNTYNVDDIEREKLDKMISFSNDKDAKYRYVTHLESKNEFRHYVINNEDADRFVFSEGITGNNSTDRLLRNETINLEWFYRHLYVMKQRVAIFDERLFSKAFGLEETDFAISRIEDFGKNLNADKLILGRIFPNDIKYINQCDNSDELKDFLVQSKSYNPITGMDKDDVESKNHLGATYAAKGLFIFSVIRSCVKESNGLKCFNLYGYYPDKNNEESFSKCYRYAELCWDTNNKQINIIPANGIDNAILHDFNLISIHQGILDKLYEAFNIKSDEQAKENLTKKFYDFFTYKTEMSKGNEKNEKKYIEFKVEGSNITHYFLPGMSIHSGRSKPAEHDMPQQLPFIPYSAIEHAVLDCKYSLVKLLNTARYE